MDLSDTDQTSAGVDRTNSLQSQTTGQPAFQTAVDQPQNLPNRSAVNSNREQDDFSQNLDDEGLLAERKQSQLQNRLKIFKKLDTLTEIYKQKILESSELKQYERDTHLGKPVDVELDQDKVVIEETTSDISLDLQLEEKLKALKKLPRYEPLKDNPWLVEEHDTLLQYVAGTLPITILHEKMDIKNDITRLCQLYLEANTKFKLSMPSENVENLLYEKIVYNICQQQPTFQQAAGSNSFRESTSMSTMNGGVPFGSVSSDKGFNKSSTLLMSDSSSSFSSVNLANNQSISAGNRNSTLSKNSKTVMAPIIIRTEEKRIEQCTPYIVRMDQNENDDTQTWQDLIDELRVNSTVTADILCLILESNLNQLNEEYFDLSHRTMLVNLTQFFFDNIYQDDRLAYSETNSFLRIFIKFARIAINPEHFQRDSIGQVQFKSEALQQMIMCMFEGVTRKIPSFNYLRFVYAGPFNRVNMYNMDQDLRRTDPPKSSSDRDKKNQDSKDKTDSDNKPGFFKKIWGSVFDKKKEEQKKEDSRKPPVTLKDGDMDFDDDKEETKTPPTLTGQPPKLFSAMTVVYGGVSDPFEQSGLERDPSQLKRFEAIEQRIQEERINTQALVCYDKKLSFKPKMHDRIIMTEEEIRRQFESRASAAKGENPRPQVVKTKKDLTYYIKSLVQKNFEQMINFQQKIPFAVRAMLRIILIRTRGLNDFNQRISVESHEIALLSQILIGGWLNTGQRNPKCFGIQPTVEKELELEFIFFQAARITFEHLMMMQRIPDEKRVDGFSVFQLNDMIKELAPQVFLFWIRLINIDISEVNLLQQEALVQQSIVRVKDLELLYSYCKRTHQLYKDISPSDNDNEDIQKRASFIGIMERIEKFEIEIQPEEDTSFADQIIFDSSLQKDKPTLVKPNRFYRSMSEYFQNLVNLLSSVPTPSEQFEYYLLFMRKKSDHSLKKKFLEELQFTRDHIRSQTEKFVANNIIQKRPLDSKSGTSASQMIQGPQEPSPAEQIESPLPKILQDPAPTLGRHQQSVPIPHRSGQRSMSGKFTGNDSSGITPGGTEAHKRLVKLSRISEDQIPIEKVTSMIINIFNTLKMVIQKKELILETLQDKSSSEEMRDLVQIFLQAAQNNSVSSNPDLYLQAGCQHLAFSIKKLNLEQQFTVQNDLLNHFCEMLAYQQNRFKKLLDIFIKSIEQFGSDVFRFEQNITNMKQFHKRFDNQLIFNKTISRYNPEVCLLSHSYELLDDFRFYKGVLLNLSCSNHQTGLPISSYMLFGVVRRSVAGALEQPLSAMNQGGTQQPLVETIIISEDELTMKKVRDGRVSRYRDHHMAYTTVTVSLQNNNTMEVKPKDEPIKLIEAFIQFYTNKQKNNLRAMIRADEEKYRAVLPLDLVEPSKFISCANDREKYDVISQSEPFDYMNLLHTYVMFLEHISVMASQNPKDDYIKEENTKVKQHYDFLRFDLQARTLRYSIHDYIMRRIHKTIFNQTKPFPKDELVQKLILAKQNDPGWVLTSVQSQEHYQQYKVTKESKFKPKDFTEKPEWTNTHIYSSSLKTLLKIIDEETPHLKALYITDAQECAIHSLRIAAPYEKIDKFDSDLQHRVTKHLMVEVCKIYEKARTNSRLYSQLMFIHLFNIPVQESINWKLLYGNANYMVNELMSLKDQHDCYLTELGTRNVAFEMFTFIQALLTEHYAAEKQEAARRAEAEKNAKNNKKK